MSDQDMQNELIEAEDVSRRRLLQLAAGGSAALVAGCGGDGGGDNGGGGGDTASPTEGRLDVPFRLMTRNKNPVTNTELNQYNQSHTNHDWQRLLGRTGLYSRNAQEVVLWDLADFTIDQDANELRATLKDDIQWHSDGEILDEVTAKDLLYQEELDLRMTPESSREENPVVTGRRVDGKKTFVFELTDTGYNTQAVLHDNLIGNGMAIAVYRNGPLGGKLEELRDATSTDEKDSIRSEVTQISKSLPDAPISGPFMVDSIESQLGEFTLNEDHWVADSLNWDTFHLRFTGDVSRFTQLQQDEVDASNAESIPPEISNPGEHVWWTWYKRSRGWCININYDGDLSDPIFGTDDLVKNAKARQALQYLIDDEKVASNVGPIRNLPHGRVTGWGSPMAKNQLGEDYKLYPKYEPDPEKAASLLREIGATKEGDTWKRPDGEPIQLSIESYSAVRILAETVTNQFSDFGIKAEHEAREDTSYINAVWGSNEYSAAFTGYGQSVPPASRALTTQIHYPNSYYGGDSEIFPEEFPVPEEIGDMEGEPTRMVNTKELVQKFETTPEEDLMEEKKLLAWVYAYNLPVLFVTLTSAGPGFQTSHFDFPEPAPERPDDGRAQVGSDHNPSYGWPHAPNIWCKGYPNGNVTAKEN